MAETKIEWAKNADGSKGKSWNPIRARNRRTGKVGHYCQKISPGCAHCYAERMNLRVTPDGKGGIGNGVPYAADKLDHVEMFLDEKVLLEPLRWKKPTTIFVCSTTDLFGSWVPFEWLDWVYAIEAICPQHTFINVTKRPQRRLDYFVSLRQKYAVERAIATCDWVNSILGQLGKDHFDSLVKIPHGLSNVIECVTVCNQDEADKHVPILQQTPAACRGVSIEPMLGQIDLERGGFSFLRTQKSPSGTVWTALDWVICGGESGPGARPMNPAWARALRDQCAAAGVPFFFKQHGEWAPIDSPINNPNDVVRGQRQCVQLDGTHFNRVFLEDVPPGAQWMERVGKKAAGRLLDGVEHNGFPEVPHA